MAHRTQFICIFSVAVLALVHGAYPPGQVRLDCNGMHGTVRINATQGSGEITFDFRDLHWYRSDETRSFVNISAAIHHLPATYRSDCSSTDVGPVYDPANAMTMGQYETKCRNDSMQCAVGDLRNRLGKFDGGSSSAVLKTTFPNDEWHLSGARSVVGRSLVLYNSSGMPFACAPIERRVVGAKREIVRKAILTAPVGGEITFTQIVDSTMGKRYDAQIIVDLFNVQGAAQSSGHGWYLDDGQISSDASCSAQGSAPSRPAGCSPANPSACSSNDLAGKHGSLTIPSGRGQRVFFTDSSLNVAELDQKAIVVTNIMADSPLSCGNVKNEDFQLGAYFNDEVKGTIMFQPAIGGTVVKVNLTGLSNKAGGYHIHVYPVVNGDCMSTGGHLDPFGVKGAPVNGSNDMYEVGDLSSLFGSFAGKMSASFKKFSHNLQLLGRFGVLGRSIVIHATDGSRWKCADILPMAPDTKKLTAVANFVGKFEGSVKFTQWQLPNNQSTDTMVDIDIKSVGHSESKNHNWHVHNKPAADFPTFNDKNCAASFTSGHYNPYNVDLGANYSSECSISNPLRCELGDLSGKHEKYNIFPKTAKAGRGYSSDPNLPLFGPLNVIGRSIVIHAENAGGPRISCASIYPDKRKFFSVMFNKPETVNNADIQSAIAQGMNIDAAEVQFLSVNSEESGNCTSATFVVRDDAVQGDDFLSVVPDGKFGSYEVNNQCLSGGEPTQEAPTDGSVNLSFSLLTVIGFLLASLLA